MDFFAHQEAADRQTRRLLALFFVAVALIIATVYLAVLILFYDPLQGVQSAESRSFWQPGLAAVVAFGVLTLIGAGSLYKILSLREGGRAVARILGGRLVDTTTTEPSERRLLNVVEEMSLASGLPVPPVYVLERERGINAFAAGFSYSDAVIAISQGALQLLSRDELQGVVGHEFSHILRGDMRLNLRLIGLLHGILLLSLIGYGIFRSVRFGALGGNRRSAGMAIAIFGLFGLLLMAIGWIGVLFGRLIKSGVSRQREYLADAAAVQFTRDPAGIAGALKKIGGLATGSRIDNPRAEEVSHLFFGDFKASRWASFLSTHPPLGERILRLDSTFEGEYPRVEGLRPSAPPASTPLASRLAEPLAQPPRERPIPILEQIGDIDQEHLDYAAALLAGLPTELREATRRPAEAIAVAYALLLDQDPEQRRQQLELIDRSEPEAVAAQTRRMQQLTATISPHTRLPLLDLLMPALGRIGYGRYQRFKEMLERLAEADRRVSLFEYTLLRHLLGHLGPLFADGGASTAQYYSLRNLDQECSVLLSALAHTGSNEPDSAAAAFDWGAGLLHGSHLSLSFLARDECSLAEIDRALDRLSLLAPRLKRDLLRSAAETIAHDRRVTLAEGELVRAVAGSLNCPVPPLLPGQQLLLS